MLKTFWEKFRDEMIDLYHKYKINIFVAAFITFWANVKLNHKNRIPWSRYFWNYFEKVAHKLVVWAYVSLWLGVFGCVLQGSIRLKELWVDARNQWDFGILKMTLLKVKQGHFKTHLDSWQFLRLLLQLKVLRSITLKYLYASKAEYSDAAV